jgi:endonuclease G
MVNPEAPERENEWISLINLTGEDVDLDGWTLTDTKRTPLDIGKDANGNKRVLGPGEAVSIKPIKPLQLADTGGAIGLYTKPEDGEARGKRVDRVTYTKNDVKKEGVPVVFNFFTPP